MAAPLGSGQPPEISVVVPVYCSEAIVPHLCAQVREALAPHAFEIVLVNDRSPDGSWAAIEREAAADPRVVGVDLRANVGQDRAIMAGLSHARGAFIVVMDDDLQHRPSDIPALYGKVREGYDVCYGAYLRKRQTMVKNAGSWLAGKVAETVLRKPPHIYMSPFKIMRREVVDQVLRYSGPFPFVDGLLFQITDNVTQIAVEHHPRHTGRTTHNVWKQAHVFLNLATNFSIMPLRAVSAAGLACSALAFLLAAYFLFVYLWRGIPVYGWTALMVVNLFFSGIMLVSVGTLGEYLARVLMNVNQFPQFVVRRRVNFDDAGPRRSQDA
jgi:polyisoprenyl-phosphate glycosyltransferase